MSSLNVFRNTYSAPENRLTYNFLCTIDLMTTGQRAFIEFLLAEKSIQVSVRPVLGIKPLYAFERARNPDEEASNPDGSIKLECRDGSILSVFLEVKTHRRPLTEDQLQRHLKCHVDNVGGKLLLVITPRPSDAKIVALLNSKNIIFISWQKIADYLTKTEFDRKIIDQFLIHSQEENEFMATELEEEDISLLLGNFKRRPEDRLKGAFDRLSAEFPFDKYLALKAPPWWEDANGRKGINLSIEDEAKKRKWICFCIYYATRDHGIPFREEIPELAMFVDISPELRGAFKMTLGFSEALRNLETLGWEENLSTHKTINEWRLLFWRKPLGDFTELNSRILGAILKERLEELVKEPAFLSNYISVKPLGLLPE